MTDSSITYWGVEVGVGVIVFIVADAAIVPFFVPGSPPVVFPAGLSGAEYRVKMTLANIINIGLMPLVPTERSKT